MKELFISTEMAKKFESCQCQRSVIKMTMKLVCYRKEKKGSKFVVTKKNKKVNMQKNGKKILKLSPKSKKTESGRKENVPIKESCEKVVGGAKSMKTQVNKQMDDLAIKRRPSTKRQRLDVIGKPYS